MEFKILKVEILDSLGQVLNPNAKVRIDAICLSDDVLVSITIKKDCMYDRHNLKKKLLEKHEEVTRKGPIEVGEIL